MSGSDESKVGDSSEVATSAPGDGRATAEPSAHAQAHPTDGAGEAAEDEALASFQDQSTEPTFFIVGIGASAGGLEALTTLIKDVELDSAALVIVQHLARTHESFLPALLSRAG